MAPKSSSHGKDKSIGAEDDVLQAVVLADSFNKRFKPLTTRKPRVFLLFFCLSDELIFLFSAYSLSAMHLYSTGRLKVLP